MFPFQVVSATFPRDMASSDSPALAVAKAQHLKTVFIKAAGFASGVTVTLVALTGLAWWWAERPKPPKPWNTHALTAEYWNVVPEGEKNNLVFYYTLTNNTDFDYRRTDASGLWVTGHLRSQQALSSFGGSLVTFDFPIFVPAHQKARFAVRIGYPYPKPEAPNMTEDEVKEFRAEVAKYVTTELSNLDGFVGFDEEHRYEVHFPSGWEQRAKEAESGPPHSQGNKQ